MREFNEYEKIIIRRICNIKSANKIKESSLMTIIREELSAFAIEWSAPSDEQQFCKLLGDNEELDGKLFHLLDIITLLSYLKYNGLILLLNTQGERDRYLYDRTKYKRKDDGTNRELVLNMLAELSTKDISAATNAQTW